MWNWMVRGLSGLVGMMCSHQEAGTEPMPDSVMNDLERHIRNLQKMLDTAKRNANG